MKVRPTPTQADLETIKDIATRIYEGEIQIEIPDPTYGIVVWNFSGYEYQMRRVARLLKYFGLPAKAKWDCKFARAFRAAQHEIMIKNARVTKYLIPETTARAREQQ